MSLLDDVSLMITPNGVAEDVLFGVLPQPIIGAEGITNGDFASDSNWSITNNTGTDSEITGGYLRIKTDGAYTAVSQSGVTVADKQYKLVYTVLSSDGGNLAVVTIGNIASSIPSSVGTHTYYFTSESTSLILKRRSGALDVIIDNVSVREYTSADMDFTRATTATRSAYSVDKVTNGDFATDSNWTKLNGSTISGGVGNVVANGSISSTGSNWSLYQENVFLPLTTYQVQFRARQTSGAGAFQVGYSYGYVFNQVITNGWEDYSVYVTTNASGWNHLSLGGAVIGNTFEISNISVKELLIEEVPRNLLENSQDFSNATWTKQTGTVVTANQALAPDGTMTAYKVVSDGSNGIFESAVYIDGIAARSVYLRSITGTLDVILKDPNTTVTTKTCSLTTTWQRFELIEDNGDAANLQGIWVDDIPADGIYMWGAQIEKGSQATTYIYTEDRLNVPRIDYTGGGCPHILSEPQRTNIITNSNSSDLNFTLDNVSMTYNSITSPDGTTNGILFEQTGSDASNSAYNHSLTTTDGSYSYSIFIKAKDSTSVRFYQSDGAAVTQDFNPQTMSAGVLAGSLSLNFEDFGGGWFRVSFTRTLSSASTHRLLIYPDRNNTQEGVYIFGLQVEVGSYPTSYIPTAGSTVTRNEELFTRTGIGDLINSAEGVIFVEFAALNNDGTNRQISLSDGTADNRVTISMSSVSNEIAGQVRSGGGLSMNKSNAMTQTDFNKVAIKWKVNDFAIWLNGTEVKTDASGAAPIGLNQLSFDKGDGLNDFFGKIRQLQVYKTALSDTQLGDLTT